MNIERISPSSYNSWDGCQHQYFLEQNLKYRYPPGKAADKGTATHLALELLALINLHRKEKPEDRIFKHKEQEINIDLNDEALIGFVEQQALNLYKPGHFTSTEKREISKWISRALTYNNGQFNPLTVNVVAPERRVKVEMKEEWAALGEDKQFFLSGIVDLVTQPDENTYEITDYKTGSLKDWNTGKQKTHMSLYQDPQLRFYHLAASEIYGEDKDFITTIFFIKENKAFSLAFTPQDLPKTKYMLRDRFEEIKSCEKPSLNRTWKCTKFCPFGKITPEKTNFPVLPQLHPGDLTPVGQNMTICETSYAMIEKFGLQWVEENYGKHKKKDS